MSYDEDRHEDNTKDALNERVIALRASVDFFSPQMKQERELWVAREFLAYLGVNFEPADLSASQDEPPDVLFLGARFEIKEILEPGRKRGMEYKDALRKAESAKHLRDLLEPYSPKSVTVDVVAASIAEESRRWKEEYTPAVVRQLDLLFYYNLQECGVVGDQIQRGNVDACLQWRSVSVVGNDCAFVLCANADAPEFIKNACWVVFRKRI